MSKCRICENEHAFDDIENAYTAYCQSCKRCTICQNYGDPTNNDSLTLEELQFAEKYKTPPAHFICMAEGFRAEIENAPQTISAKHLDWLNSLHLMFNVNEELSPESNIVEATFATQRFLVGKSGHYLYKYLKRLEAATAVISIAIKRDRRNLELEVSAEERKKYLAATSKQDTAARGQAPSRAEVKKQSTREKAIDQLMKYGAKTRQEAEEIIDKAQGTLK